MKRFNISCVRHRNEEFWLTVELGPESIDTLVVADVVQPLGQASSLCYTAAVARTPETFSLSLNIGCIHRLEILRRAVFTRMGGDNEP